MEPPRNKQCPGCPFREISPREREKMTEPDKWPCHESLTDPAPPNCRGHWEARGKPELNDIQK